ncbi:colicin immunity protein [Haloferula sp.]|uniref:colicin immunity protein n=1 Tax=Haloferula sp. TaxID=2497595 RepID=UPI00329D9DE4
MDASLPEEELDRLYQMFSDNVSHPDGANLFFYPENYNARRDDISKYDPKVEEVVDLALSYKAIQL